MDFEPSAAFNLANRLMLIHINFEFKLPFKMMGL